MKKLESGGSQELLHKVCVCECVCVCVYVCVCVCVCACECACIIELGICTMYFVCMGVCFCIRRAWCSTYPSLQYLDGLFERDPKAGAEYHERQVDLYARYDPDKLLPFLRSCNDIPLQKVGVVRGVVRGDDLFMYMIC